MIYEYAINPEMLTDAGLCSLLGNSFGESRGRLVSQFPEHWESLVWTAIADARPVAKKVVEETLARLKRRMFPRLHRWEDGGWIDEAIREHGQRPFRAILSDQRPGGRPYILAGRDLDEANPFWNVETNLPVRRSAAAMCDCAATLLASGKEILFVDYFFEPNERKWLLPLGRFFDCIHRRTTGVPIHRIEIHTQARSTVDFFREHCATDLADIVPAGMQLTVVRWEPHADLHNRYILTNRGGLEFSHGLDEGNGDDDVTILSSTTHSKRWGEYQKSTSKFVLAGEFPVVGRKR